MRILITGSEGKIGKETVKALIGNELLLVDKKGKNSMECNLAYNDLEFIEKFKPEVIVHLAASFERTDESPMFQNINFEDNIMASYRLNNVIRNLDYCPKQYIFASSYLVYDPFLYLSTLPVKYPRLLSECDEINPRNLIGASKLYIENEINFIQRNVHKDMNVCHLRIFRAFGEGGQEFISRLIDYKKGNIPVEIWKPENTFDYIHTSDCANAIKLAMNRNAQGVYNLGSGNPTSIWKVIETIKPKINWIKKDDLYESSCSDNDRIEEELGFKPNVNVIDWIKDNL